MFGVQHRAHARAGCTKIVALLRILGGFGWSQVPGEEILMHSLTIIHIHTCTHTYTSRKKKIKGHGIDEEGKETE